LSKLRRLGREHARIHVRNEHLYEFCDILLSAIIQSTGLFAASELVTVWRRVFKFVVHYMTAEQYVFQRSVGGRIVSEAREERAQPASAFEITSAAPPPRRAWDDQTIESLASSSEDGVVAFRVKH
jgi:hypothetical protein